MADKPYGDEYNRNVAFQKTERKHTEKLLKEDYKNLQ